ncbi:hypothetical protein IFM89_030830 [Coptis chinensis]|uniref:Uncharacterized protein n=1 Tax=Coptis chinensis TaxID=261450 RepID=A0A835IHP2_9MAGN|nr:hypothetical protein IFM89_030830 [Coptis chinensis]
MLILLCLGGVYTIPMAGMLPGVECARRRRCHQGGWTDSNSLVGQGQKTRFCLYTSNHETHLNSNSSLQRNASNQNFQEDKLEAAAREAKQRLHKKLRFQWKLESKSSNGGGSMKTDDRDSALCSMILGIRTEAYGSKKGA